MAYVKANGTNIVEYPYSFQKLKEDNPNTSYPRSIDDAWLETKGIYRVTVDAQPSFDRRTEMVTQNSTPTHNGTNWVLGWTKANKSADDITAYDNDLADVNRGKRNVLLADTDYYGLSDVTMSAAMTTYRQALRDLPTHANWPNLGDDDWPTKP